MEVSLLGVVTGNNCSTSSSSHSTVLVAVHELWRK